MPKHLLHRWRGYHIIGVFILLIAMSVLLMAFQWILGAAGLMLTGILGYYTMRGEETFRKGLSDYVATLSHRVKRAGNEVINDLPIGMILFNEEKEIVWHNPYVGKMLDKESVVGQGVLELFPVLKSRKEQENRLDLTIGAKTYTVLVKAEERLLYIFETTPYTALVKKYEEEKLAVGIVLMDNLDEATQGMDDQLRSITLAKVTGEITSWAQKYNLYLRRVSSDRYMFFMDQKALRALEQSRFEILDEVKDITIDQKLPFTLSIGIASGVDSLMEMGNLAQASLDIALGRGGDQAAVRIGQKLSFYGGRSNAVEKRTRVRARVISHALRDLIKDSDKVIIMGHKMPDMDALGAAIGVLKAVHLSNKEGYILLEDVNPSIERLYEEIKDNERLFKSIVKPEQALGMVTPRTLVIVVDTHKASMLKEPRILHHSHRIVIVDHHRRSEEFINDAILVYMEPYASSTCELITELLQYFSERLALEVLEATALLAGIVVDTKSFALHTGARTFEAAGFLRRNGADATLVQRMLKQDLKDYVEKAEIIKHAEILSGQIALAVTQPNRKYSQLLIAQVADTLLNMNDIMASFVISERQDGLIGISARSLGQINVQVIMERMGGGGHLTNAAVQMEGTLQEAEERLKQVLKQMDEEEGLIP